MKKAISYIFVIIGIWACTPKPKKPNFVPDQEQMSLLLADIYQVESVMSQSGRRIVKDDEKNAGYYKSILDEYHLTKVEFDSAISWYSSHPELFSDVYDDVISILSKRDAIVKKELAEQSAEKKDVIEQIPDKKSIWVGENNYKLPLEKHDSTDIFLPFKIKADSIESGIVRLNAGFTFIKGNELDSALLRMWLCYADSTADTVRYLINKTFKKQIGNVSQIIPDGKTLVSIEGFLFEHDTTKVSNVEIEDVKMVLLPKLGAAELLER